MDFLKKYGTYIDAGILKITLVIIIAAFFSTSNISFGISVLDDMDENWKKKPITEIIESRTSCPVGYEKFNNDSFPGTIAGCDCTKMWFSTQYFYKVYSSYCTRNQTRDGCRDIPPLPAYPLNLWEETLLCVKQSNLDYNDLTPDIAEGNDDCGFGLKKCGKLDSLGNSICINENLDCPINKMIILSILEPKPSDYNYTEIKLGNNKVLYFTNEATEENVFVNTKTSEGKVCLDPDQVNSQSNPYTLIRNKNDYFCTNGVNGNFFDNRYTLLDAYSTLNYFTENKLMFYIGLLPQYPLESITNSQTNIYSRSFIGWKKNCDNYEIRNANEIIQSYKSKQNLIIILEIIFFISFLSFFLVRIINCCQDCDCVSISFYSDIVFLIANIISLIFICLARSTATNLIEKFNLFNDLNCGDQITTQILDYITNSVSSGISKFLYILIMECLLIILILLRVIFYYFRRENSNIEEEENKKLVEERPN